MPTVLIAPERRPFDGPLVFLAGPTWTWQWQERAIGLLGELAPWLNVANPRRPLDGEGDFGPAQYAEQVDWETEHLRRAASTGAVLFWLARERDHRCDRAYAQTTRLELGEWMAAHRLTGAKLVVGIEEGFTGARYIRRRLGQDCPGVRIQRSLEATCREAVAVSALRHEDTLRRLG